MAGIATNVEEQIQKLTDRGMVLDLGIEKAKEILLDIGYYRLGFYWNPFEVDRQHNFIDGTKFSDVVKLYYLDVDLKNILNKAINRIEINLRTQLIYNASNKYPEFPTWFANKKIMYSNFVDDFPNYYTTKFKENNKPIKKHHANYLNDIYAPAWKTIEFLSFGSIYTMYSALSNEELKIQIANYYGIKKTRVFLNYFKTIIFIRNICAHSGLLFDCNTPKEIATSPLIQFNNNRNNRHSLDSSIKVVLYFLGIISDGRKTIIEKEIIDLFNSHEDNHVIMNIITSKIGYVKK